MARLRMQGQNPSPSVLESRPTAGQFGTPKFKFPEMEKGTDPDTYLQSFEKTCKQHHLAKDQWARFLTPNLRDKALEAFVDLPAEQDNDYDAIKAAIIAKYQLTPEVYRKKFRSLQKGHTDSYADLNSRLLTVFRQWSRGLNKDSHQGLEDLIVQEQLLNCCTPDVRQFVLERKPESAKTAAELADTYVATRVPDSRKPPPLSQGWRGGRPMQPSSPPPPANRGNRVPQRPVAAPVANLPDEPYVPRCFQCGERGHLKSACPEVRTPSSEPGPEQAHHSTVANTYLVSGASSFRLSGNHQVVEVNNQIVAGFRDTGAELTLVRSHLVAKKDRIPNEFVTLVGVGGTRARIAKARVVIDWGMGRQTKVVGVTDDIPVTVLLGTDLGTLRSFYEPLIHPQDLRSGPTQVLYKLGEGQREAAGVMVPISPREGDKEEVPALKGQLSNNCFSDPKPVTAVPDACIPSVDNDHNCDVNVVPCVANAVSDTYSSCSETYMAENDVCVNVLLSSLKGTEPGLPVSESCKAAEGDQVSEQAAGGLGLPSCSDSLSAPPLPVTKRLAETCSSSPIPPLQRQPSASLHRGQSSLPPVGGASLTTRVKATPFVTRCSDVPLEYTDPHVVVLGNQLGQGHAPSRPASLTDIRASEHDPNVRQRLLAVRGVPGNPIQVFRGKPVAAYPAVRKADTGTHRTMRPYASGALVGSTDRYGKTRTRSVAKRRVEQVVQTCSVHLPDGGTCDE